MKKWSATIGSLIDLATTDSDEFIALLLVVAQIDLPFNQGTPFHHVMCDVVSIYIVRNLVASELLFVAFIYFTL